MLDWANNSKKDGNGNVNFPGFTPSPSRGNKSDEEMKKHKQKLIKNFLTAAVLIVIIIGSIIVALKSLESRGLIKIFQTPPSTTPIIETPLVVVAEKIQSSCVIVEEQYCSGFKLINDLKDTKKVIGVGESFPVGTKVAAPFDGYGIIMKGTDPTDSKSFYPMVAFISGDAPVPPTPKDNVRALWIGNVNLNKASYLKFSKGDVIGEIASDKVIIKEKGLNSYFLGSINTVTNHPELQLLTAASDYLKNLIQISAQ